MRKHIPPYTAWHQGLGAALAIAIALTLYLRTGAPGLTWSHAGADGGDLITASMTWGVPHPSGYPTYILLTRLFAWAIPVEPVARRFVLFSNLTAALSVGLVYLWLRQMLCLRARDPWLASLTALGCALGWATAPALWHQAVIAEVYTLQSCLTALCLLISARISGRISGQDQPGREWRWPLLGLLLGASLGAHLTTLLLWPGLLLLLWPRRNNRRLAWLTIGSLMGASVYAYLPLAARMSPLVNWGNARSWPGFWWVVSGRIYQGYLFHLPLSALPSRLAAYAQMWRTQLSALGMLVAGAGLSALAESERPWLRATLLIATLYSVYAIAYDTADSHVYMLTALMVGALWLAFGTDWLIQTWLAKRPQTPLWATRAAAAALLGGLALWLALHGYAQADLSQDTQATRWLQETLALLPPDAVIVTGQDRHTFALDYALWVEGRRQDIIVLDGELAADAWYRHQLTKRYPVLALPDPDQTWTAWLVELAADRPLYLASPRPELEAWFTTQRVGSLESLSLRNARGSEGQ